MASPVKDAKLKAQEKWLGAYVGQTPEMVAKGIPARGKGYIHHVYPDNPQRGMFDAQAGGRGWHFGDGQFTEANEVDTQWVDADPILDAPWIKKMVLADYNAFFGPGTQEFNAGQIVKYIHPSSGEDVTFEVQQLQWTNDLDQIEAIADPQQITPTSITDDTITWEGAFGSGLDFQWETQTARLSKRLIIDQLSSIGSPPQFIIDGGNPVLRLQFIFQKSSGVEIWIDGVEWDEKSNNPQSTSGNVEFKLTSTGETLWHFKRAWVVNSGNDESLSVAQRFRKVALNLLVEVRVPWSWLETATYPIEIDPTVDEQAAASDDDAAEIADTTVDIDSTFFRNSAANMYTAARWAVAVPNGATITAATADWYVNNINRDETEHDILVEDADNAAAYQEINADISGRNYQAGVDWHDGDLGSSGGDWASDLVVLPDISDEVELTVARGGWSSGNYLAVALTWTGAEGDFQSVFWDSNPALAPKIHIEYTTADVSNLPRVKPMRIWKGIR